MEDNALQLYLHIKIAIGQIEEALTELKVVLKELEEEIKNG